MEGWQSKILSFPGRLERIKTVIYNTLAYWYQAYKCAASVCRELETMAARFLWKGKVHAWSWLEGGAGIRRLSDICKAAELKLIWRCYTSDSLRASWMKYNYVKHHSIWDAPVSLMDSGT